VLEKLTEREKKIVSTVLIVLILVLCYQLIWKKQYSRLSNLAASKEEAVSKISRGEEAAVRLKELNREIGELRSDFNDLSNKFFPGSGQEAIIEVAGILEKYGSISFIEPGEEVKRKDYVVLPLKVGFRGSYEGILGGIEAIESSARAISIEGIKLGFGTDRSGMPSGANIMEAELQLYLYQLPRKKGEQSTITAGMGISGTVANPFKLGTSSSPDSDIRTVTGSGAPAGSNPPEEKLEMKGEYEFPGSPDGEPEPYLFPRR